MKSQYFLVHLVHCVPLQALYKCYKRFPVFLRGHFVQIEEWTKIFLHELPSKIIVQAFIQTGISVQSSGRTKISVQHGFLH